MADNMERICLKCGFSSHDDPNIKLQRFPKPVSTNIRRCEMWAKFCFPDENWSSVDFQNKLYSENRMLCNKHFKDSDFTDIEEKKLSQHAVPDIIESDKVVSPVVKPKLIRKPKYTIMYKKCRRHMKKICQLCNRRKELRRKEVLDVLNENKSVKYLMKKIKPSIALILQSQLRNIKRKNTVRDWTFEEKIMALRLYKRSGTCYRLLRRIWCLPEPSTLKLLLSKFPLDTGINDNIFNRIKKYIKRNMPSDAEYILMFDEMPIRPHVWYNAEQDKIVGFQDHGSHGRSQEFVEYALVFMVTDLRKQIKQPVAFYLSGDNVSPKRLSVLIKEVLNKCFEIGMSILATVCDIDGVNKSALRILGASKNHPYFNINNHEVVAIFDTPHLLKSFRNSFLEYNIKCYTNIVEGEVSEVYGLVCKTNNKLPSTSEIEIICYFLVLEGIAKWSHIKDFYELDKDNKNFVFAPALSYAHLNPTEKQKMKLDLAVEVLNHPVAVGIFGKIGSGELPADAPATAEVISNMDKLFEAVNSDTDDPANSKPLSTNMTTMSPHIKHFEAMLNFFEDVVFVGCQSPPPVKDGWIWTINGVIKVFQNLKIKHGIKSLAVRRFQLESLENLFSTIKAKCGATPTSTQFVAELRIMIISEWA